VSNSSKAETLVNRILRNIQLDIYSPKAYQHRLCNPSFPIMVTWGYPLLDQANGRGLDNLSSLISIYPTTSSLKSTSKNGRPNSSQRPRHPRCSLLVHPSPPHLLPVSISLHSLTTLAHPPNNNQLPQAQHRRFAALNDAPLGPRRHPPRRLQHSRKLQPGAQDPAADTDGAEFGDVDSVFLL